MKAVSGPGHKAWGDLPGFLYSGSSGRLEKQKEEQGQYIIERCDLI